MIQHPNHEKKQDEFELNVYRKALGELHKQYKQQMLENARQNVQLQAVEKRNRHLAAELLKWEEKYNKLGQKHHELKEETKDPMLVASEPMRCSFCHVPVTTGATFYFNPNGPGSPGAEHNTFCSSNCVNSYLLRRK